MERNQNLHVLLANGLEGKHGHVEPKQVFEELDWIRAGQVVPSCPHSIWQILSHLIYWQEFSLALLEGESPLPPAHAADTWTAAVSPKEPEEWKISVESFLQGVERVVQMLRNHHGGHGTSLSEPSHLETLISLMIHNSYHLGQIVLIRRMLGVWPPASGGDTW